MPTVDPRSEDRLRDHYEIEKELAQRLRTAPADERLGLYSAVYDELFARVADHPQNTWKADPEARTAEVQANLGLLAPYLSPGATYLEVGVGDCAVALAVRQRVGHVYAVDVSATITAGLPADDGFDLVLTDGVSIPVPPGSVDVAYSNQLMEHLHPEDAEAQLRNIHTALAPGGVYICQTPNRLFGPSDISGLYDDEPTGFHLHEYTVRELSRLCRRVGFGRLRFIVWLRWRGFAVPTAVPIAFEWLLGPVSQRLRQRIAGSQLQRFLGVTLAAQKPR